MVEDILAVDVENEDLRGVVEQSLLLVWMRRGAAVERDEERRWGRRRVETSLVADLGMIRFINKYSRNESGIRSIGPVGWIYK